MSKVMYFSVQDATDPVEIVAAVRRQLKPVFVDRLYPRSKSPETSRRYYVEVDERANVQACLEELGALPGVTNVEQADERYAV